MTKSAKPKTLPAAVRPGWLKRGDQRSQVYRDLHHRLSEFGEQYGGLGELSAMQRSLVERLVHVEALIGQMEEAMRDGKPVDVLRYCSLVDRLHGIGKTMGLRRVAKTVGLHDYMQGKKMKLREFITDPRLGNMQPPSFRTWHVVASLLDGDGNKLKGEDRDIAQAITQRTRFPTTPFPDLFLLLGRRSGKTHFVANVNAFSVAQDMQKKLAPGERAVAAAVAPTTDQASILFDYTRAVITNSQLLAQQVVRETANEIEFAHGSVFKVYAGSMRTARGPTFSRVSIDEASFLRSDEAANPDVELVRAVRPGLMTLDGSLICFSSPYMRRGVMHDMHRKHFGDNDSNTLVIVGDSLTFNPTLNREAIAAAYADDPESASAEWGGNFRADLSSAFAPEWLDAALCSGVHERGRVIHLPSGTAPQYVAFTDPAGGTGKDSWTTTVVHAEAEVLVEDATLEVRPPFNTGEAAERVAQFLKTYGLGAVKGDRYAGAWPRDALAARGIGYAESELAKSDIYRECVSLFSSGRVRLLDQPRTMTQLRQLERRTRPGGRDVFDHPGGAHDDLCNSLCGALHAAGLGISQGGNETFAFRSQAMKDFDDFRTREQWL